MIWPEKGERVLERVFIFSRFLPSFPSHFAKFESVNCNLYRARGGDATTAMRRHYSVRKGGSLLVLKLDNQEIRKSRTDRVSEIFQYLKAPRNAKRGSASGRRKVKYFRFSSGRKVSNFAKHLAVQLKEQPMRTVPTFEDRRIGYGRRLMRNRKNGSNWEYNPALEPDFNVERFGKDEDVCMDKVNDENEDEEDEEDEEDDSYFNYDRPRYSPFDEAGKRMYLIFLEEDIPCGSDDYIKNLFLKALKCSEIDVDNRELWSCWWGDRDDCLMFTLTEEEADGFAGLFDEVHAVRPV